MKESRKLEKKVEHEKAMEKAKEMLDKGVFEWGKSWRKRISQKKMSLKAKDNGLIYLRIFLERVYRFYN